MNRRELLKALGAAGTTLLGAPLGLAATNDRTSDEFFVFIFARGGWDVTLFADPRNEAVGLVDPASTAVLATNRLRHWRDAPLNGGTKTFEPVRTPSGQVVGPAIGGLFDLHDRLTVLNGVAMNTVGHLDGTAYAVTGSHLRGSGFGASSVDTMISDAIGRGQLLPTVSMVFTSTFVGDDLDARAVPVRTNTLGRLVMSLRRNPLHMPISDAAAVTALLSEEAAALHSQALHKTALIGLEHQYRALARVIEDGVATTFDPRILKQTYPAFDYAGPYHGGNAVNAAFAVDAMKNDLVRCVSFALDGFDTHRADYRGHGEKLQEMFDMVAALVHELDRTPHPTRPSDKLADHTHIVLLSEFGRTPRINPARGRDHWPTASTLIISSRFESGQFGATDVEQILPLPFSESEPALGPHDVIATLLAAGEIDPRRYISEGRVVRELLA